MDCGSSDGACWTDTHRTPMRRDQRSRASDHRAGREPRAAGIEHSAHYAHNVGALCSMPAPAFHTLWAMVRIEARSCCIVTVFVFFGSFRG
jgi:hypothetical protein